MQTLESYSWSGISPNTAYLPPAATSVVSDDLRAQALAIADAYRRNQRNRPSVKPLTRAANRPSGNRITATEYRAHRDGTRPLAGGRYICDEEDGRQTIVDVGAAACAEAVLQRTLHRAEMARAALGESRPRKARKC